MRRVRKVKKANLYYSYTIFADVCKCFGVAGNVVLFSRPGGHCKKAGMASLLCSELDLEATSAQFLFYHIENKNQGAC
jgi:hypothetical protein